MTGQTPLNPAGIAVYPQARGENRNHYYGQEDLIFVPTVFPRYSTPAITQVQLSNGWDRTDMGMKDPSAAASYLSQVAAFQPGQTRLTGTQPSAFVMTSPAPQQWDAHVASTAGMQPNYTGGVGTVSGIVNRGSAGA